MIILGIDPGKSGGCVFLHQDGDLVEMMVGTDPYELSYKIKALYKVHQIKAIIEKAQSFPGNGAHHMFNYGTGYGEILGVMAALEIPFTLVHPNLWSRTMLTGVQVAAKPKERNLIAFKRLYPKLDLRGSDRAKKQHEGLVDALLIAEYGRRQMMYALPPQMQS